MRAHEEHHARGWALALWYRDRAQAAKTAEGAATASLVTGAMSMVCVCVPVLSIVAVVLGWRSHSLARRAQMPVPWSAWVGTALGVVTLLGSGAMWTWMIVDVSQESAEDGARIQALQRQAASVRGPLAHDQACALAELHARTVGYSGGKIAQMGPHFDCPGKLSLVDDGRAVLDDFRIRTSGESTVVTACLRRGDRWSVEALIAPGGACFSSGAAPSQAAAPPASSHVPPMVAPPPSRDRPSSAHGR
jgi:hypothetical protein